MQAALYIAEDGSDRVRAKAAEAEAAAVCRIAWAEAHAAFARRAREVPEDAMLIEQAKQLLATDWPRFVILEINQPVVELAGTYADAFALRGYDSVQLAAAFRTAEISQLTVCFACFDLRLNKAARLLGMNCL